MVIVLDASGSMTEEFPGTDLTRWEAAKIALRRVVGMLSDNTRVGLYIFSDTIPSGKMVLELGPKNEAAMTQALERIKSLPPSARPTTRARGRNRARG